MKKTLQLSISLPFSYYLEKDSASGIQAHLSSFIKFKVGLRIKRPQVQILPSAPRTARVLSPLAGFFITE